MANAGDGYVMEAGLPAGWPAPGEVEAISLVTIPAHRAAESSGFWPLFMHIKQAGIPMTAPVTRPVAATSPDAAPPAASMRFLYPSATTPAAAAANGVRIIDVPAQSALRLTRRGPAGREAVAAAVTRLRAEAERLSLVASDQLTLCEYNSPMLSPAKRTWEILLAVRADESP